MRTTAFTSTSDLANGIGALIKALGLRYVQYVNRTCGRSSSLWEGRFWSCLTQEEFYLLSCQRFIELNPVRAGTVVHPTGYRWLSFRANGHGEASGLITPHLLYVALISSSDERQAAYRKLFRCELEAGPVDTIRQAINGNFVLGNASFGDKISRVLGQRAVRGKPGRVRKSDEPTSMTSV